MAHDGIDDQADEATVVRPRTPPMERSIGAGEDLDADTVIPERSPFVDVPIEALAQLRDESTRVPSAPTPLARRPPAESRTAYRFIVNADPPIGLDAPAIVGRRPTLPRIMTGRPPRLVRVPSPLREVSSTHLELRQHGAVVVVTDLRSTNGSIVTVPGRDPVKLRQGESAVVGPGTRIDIGDGNLVEILPPQTLPMTTEGLPA